jgi:hypothetical protein
MHLYLEVSVDQAESETFETRCIAVTPVMTLPCLCVVAMDVIRNVLRFGKADSCGCTKCSFAMSGVKHLRDTWKFEIT